MQRYVRRGGLTVLGLAPAVMIGAAAFGIATDTAGPSPPVVLLVTGPALALLASVTAAETGSLGDLTAGERHVEPQDALPVLAVAAGAPATRLLAIDAGLGVVLAAALVGLLVDVVVSTYSAEVYCGAFVGMASPTLFPSLVTVTAAGVVAGLVFVAASGVFDGYGGKLGTTAFVGCSAVALPLAASGGTGTLVTAWTAAAFAVVGAAGAVATFVLGVRGGRGPVAASALVGLAGGCLPLLGVPAGERLAAVVFCASFAGMSSPRRLATARALAAAGACCGLLVAASGGVFVGAGGKLGTIAFASCLLVSGVERVGEASPAWLVGTGDDTRS
jgi:hypothetical protein